jgi:hypothetical protein
MLGELDEGCPQVPLSPKCKLAGDDVVRIVTGRGVIEQMSYEPVSNACPTSRK